MPQSELPRYLNASVLVRSAERFGLLPLLGAFNSRGTFLPGPLLNEGSGRDGGSERIIGRILAGRGYRTLIYVSGPEASRGRFSFCDTQGEPLALPFR